MSRWFPVSVAAAFLIGFISPFSVASVIGRKDVVAGRQVRVAQRINCPIMWYDLWNGAFIGCSNHPLWTPEIGPIA